MGVQRTGTDGVPQGKVGEWTPSASLSTDALGNTIAQGAMNTGDDANSSTSTSTATLTQHGPVAYVVRDGRHVRRGGAEPEQGARGGSTTATAASTSASSSCTRASASPFSADLKDFIAPQPIIARSCAIEGTKYHDLDADGDAGRRRARTLPGFRIYADKNDSGSFEAGEPNTFTADGTQPGKPLGSWVLDELPAGNYKIREDLTNTSGNPRATEGWNCSDPSPCHFDVPLANGGVVGGLEFGNYKKAPRARREADRAGWRGGLLRLHVVASGQGNLQPDRRRPRGGAREAGRLHGVRDAASRLQPDERRVHGWRPAVTSPTAVQFNATSGKTITCTYTNSRKTGELTVRKVLDPTADPGKFDLKIGSDVVVDDGGHLAQGTRTLAHRQRLHRLRDRRHGHSAREVRLLGGLQGRRRHGRLRLRHLARERAGGRRPQRGLHVHQRSPAGLDRRS